MCQKRLHVIVMMCTISVMTIFTINTWAINASIQMDTFIKSGKRVDTGKCNNAAKRSNYRKRTVKRVNREEMKYSISESTKTSVIATVDFLKDNIDTLKDVLKELDQ